MPIGVVILLIINHNISAMTAYRNMNYHGILMGRAMERISSGKRINRAADDPAGLSISMKMQAQIRGLSQAARNAQDGISAIQIAEGALNESHSLLQRMRELAVQAANDVCTPQDRKNIQTEINMLTSEINRIGNTTEFNTLKLLDNSITKYDGVHSELRLQVGANEGQSMGIFLEDMRAAALNISGTAGGNITSKDGSAVAVLCNIDLQDPSNGVTNGNNNTVQEYALDVSSADKAGAAIKIIDDAINSVSGQRSSLGATQNILEHRISYLNNTELNLTEAESRISDADIAKEMMEYTKQSILFQAAQAMLAQANNQQKGILELLKAM